MLSNFNLYNCSGVRPFRYGYANDLTDYTDELANRYKVSQTQVSEPFETIRLIILQYDNLIDSGAKLR